MKEIKIETEFIKLDQFLKFTALAQTGGESKMMIKDGLVKVNGEKERKRGRKLVKGDRVEIKDIDSYIVI